LAIREKQLRDDAVLCNTQSLLRGHIANVATIEGRLKACD
jgi:hypothetical protein